jgi:hypothetical protein
MEFVAEWSGDRKCEASLSASSAGVRGCQYSVHRGLVVVFPRCGWAAGVGDGTWRPQVACRSPLAADRAGWGE